MNSISNLSLSGLLLAGAGVAMLGSESIGISASKFLIPALFFFSGILSILFARANPQHKLANQYHMFHGAVLIAFALLVAMVPNTLSDFLKFVTYYVIFFGMVEILFGFMALNSGEKLNTGVLISRFIGGFANLIGGVLLLVTSISDQMSGLTIAGILMVLGGLAIVAFSFRIKKILA